MTYEDRRRIAYHEAGHAYAMVKLYKKYRLIKVTIIRHGGALGFAAPKPIEETHTSTKEELLDRIQVAVASRAAEEIFMGIQMTGVTSDLQNATVSAALLIGAYGMNDSLISYLPLGFNGLIQAAVSSPELKGRMDTILNTEYRKIKQLIENNKEAVSAIAEALILRNELTDIDVNEILARVEAQYPFVDPHKVEERPFGLLASRALPEPVTIRRNGRQNGSTNGHGKPKEPISVPLASQEPPAEPSNPSAELDVAVPPEEDHEG
jgi:ATP-dependent Zn protease